MTEEGSEYLNGTAARYKTVLTAVAFAGPPAWAQILTPDSRRWYVRFESSSGGSTMAQVCGGEATPPAALNNLVPSPQEFKFRDSPSLVAGTWWSNGGLGTGLLITEIIYVGE